MSQRTQRVGDVLRAELATVLLREVSDPRIQGATVMAVEVSSDLRHATVWVSMLGSEDERAGALEALARAQGHVRRCLSRRVHLRVIPELRFRLDRGAEHSQRISDLLEDGDDHGQAS